MSEQSLSLEQRGFEYGVKHLIISPPGSLLDILAERLDMPPENFSHLLQLGAIYVEGQRTSSNLDILKDTYVRVHSKPRRFPPNDHQWQQRLLFENENFLVVNKPSGLPCHPSVDNNQENLLVYLQEDLQKEIFLTHRLDVPTNGILVFAKSKEFQSLFNTLLKDRGINKIYRAICTAAPPVGLHRHYMTTTPRAPKTVSSEPHENSQLCELEVLKTTARDDRTHEVRIRLLTGRTHQIRAQLSALGFPIIGDHMYGAKKIYEEEKIELTACELTFKDPLTEQEHHFKI